MKLMSCVLRGQPENWRRQFATGLLSTAAAAIWVCWAGCCIGVVEEAAVSAAQTLPLPLGSGSFCIGKSLTQEIAADADAPAKHLSA